MYYGKAKGMTGVINEEQNTALPCIGVLNFTPLPDASRYLLITEFVVLSNG